MSEQVAKGWQPVGGNAYERKMHGVTFRAREWNGYVAWWTTDRTPMTSIRWNAGDKRLIDVMFEAQRWADRLANPKRLRRDVRGKRPDKRAGV